jgi:hypothetical protein
MTIGSSSGTQPLCDLNENKIVGGFTFHVGDLLRHCIHKTVT